MILPSVVSAVTTTPITVYLEDEADLFTDTEETKLINQCKAIQKKYKVDVIILTRETSGNKSPEWYLEDYYDEHFDIKKDIAKDTVLVLRTINNRWIQIQGYGKCETFINSNRIDTILDDMTPDLRNNDYYDAFTVFTKDINKYMGRHPNPLTWTWVQLLIAAVIGAIVTACMVSQSGGKVTTDNRTYLDMSHSGLVAKRDIYLNTTVRRIHHPQPSSSGGRSGGGGRVSSGGHSHSSGGRSI